MSDEDRNLLAETRKQLAAAKKTEDSVCWCGNREFRFSWETFVRLADKTYYAGFGSPNVMTDLLVVGEDWWLERHEYDGAEWWEYKELPKAPEKIQEPKRLIASLWPTLSDEGMKDSDYDE